MKSSQRYRISFPISPYSILGWAFVMLTSLQPSSWTYLCHFHVSSWWIFVSSSFSFIIIINITSFPCLVRILLFIPCSSLMSLSEFVRRQEGNVDTRIRISACLIAIISPMSFFVIHRPDATDAMDHLNPLANHPSHHPLTPNTAALPPSPPSLPPGSPSIVANNQNTAATPAATEIHIA